VAALSDAMRRGARADRWRPASSSSSREDVAFDRGRLGIAATHHQSPLRRAYLLDLGDRDRDRPRPPCPGTHRHNVRSTDLRAVLHVLHHTEPPLRAIHVEALTVSQPVRLVHRPWPNPPTWLPCLLPSGQRQHHRFRQHPPTPNGRSRAVRPAGRPGQPAHAPTPVPYTRPRPCKPSSASRIGKLRGCAQCQDAPASPGPGMPRGSQQSWREGAGVWEDLHREARPLDTDPLTTRRTP
jgi:hypothetical protein